VQSSLSAIKQSKEILLQALRDAGAAINGDLNHIRSPFREDQTGSLAVFERDGVWAFKDHGGNAHGTVVDVVKNRFQLSDSEAVKRTVALYGNGSISLPKPTKTPREFYPTLDELVVNFERSKNAKCTRRDPYYDSVGNVSFYALRFDYSDGKKTVRPAHSESDGWILADPSGALPLFNLPALMQRRSEPIIVVEGEKCAAALIERGFLATTSAHGAKSSQKSDWSALAGRIVTIWPDADDDGRFYAECVSKILLSSKYVCAVKTVDISPLNLADGADVVDIINELGNEGKTGEEIAAYINAIVDGAAPLIAGPRAARYKTVRELIAHYPQMREPVIHGLLRLGETMNIIAPPKTKKSFLGARRIHRAPLARFQYRARARLDP